MSTTIAGRLSWAVVSPPVAAVVLAVTWGSHPGTIGNVVVGIAVVGLAKVESHAIEAAVASPGLPLSAAP